MYTIYGYTVDTTEQARTILLMAKLKNLPHVAKQARSVLELLGG